MTPEQRIERIEHDLSFGRSDINSDDFDWMWKVARAAVAWTGGTQWSEGEALSQVGADRLNAIIRAVEGSDD